MRKSICLAAGLAITLGVAGCDTIQGQNPTGGGAAVGAVAGASNGAMIGGSLTMGHPAGIVIGGVVGAASGAMVASAATPAGVAAPRQVAVAAPPPVAAPQPVAVAPPPPDPAPRPVAVNPPGPPELQQRLARQDAPYPSEYAPPRPRRQWDEEFDGPPPGYYAEGWGYPPRGPALGYAPEQYVRFAPFPPRPRRCPVLAYDFQGDLVCAY